MKLEDIFSKYTDSVAQLHLYQRSIKKNAENELSQLAEYQQAFEAKPDFKEFSSSFHSMFFRVASDGRHAPFAHRKTTVEDRMTQVDFRKNKQYQWLISEAYELYADFVEEAYAYAGFTESDLWPLSDFGSISVSEIGTKEYQWFLAQTKSKRDLPQSALNRLRAKIPEYKKIEHENKVHLDLKLLIILVEHLRHIIVHNGGVVSDRDVFIKNIIKKCGYSMTGESAADRIKTIENYFGVEKYKNTIVLLEIRAQPDMPLDIHINLFDYLSSGMVTAAHALFETLVTREKK